MVIEYSEEDRNFLNDYLKCDIDSALTPPEIEFGSVERRGSRQKNDLKHYAPAIIIRGRKELIGYPFPPIAFQKWSKEHSDISFIKGKPALYEVIRDIKRINRTARKGIFIKIIDLAFISSEHIRDQHSKQELEELPDKLLYLLTEKLNVIRDSFRNKSDYIEDSEPTQKFLQFLEGLGKLSKRMCREEIAVTDFTRQNLVFTDTLLELRMIDIGENYHSERIKREGETIDDRYPGVPFSELQHAIAIDTIKFLFLVIKGGIIQHTLSAIQKENLLSAFEKGFAEG